LQIKRANKFLDFDSIPEVLLTCHQNENENESITGTNGKITIVLSGN